MRLIERYILLRILWAMVAAIIALASLVWTTQALRQLDLVTAKGQALATFFEITLLALPFLILVILPFALLGAAIVVISQMNSDSELIVVNASGGGRGTLLRPLLAAGLVTSLLIALLVSYLAPAGLQVVRERLTQVRVDLIAVIVKPGRFITVDEGLTFHIRDRDANGTLIGLMLNDDRDEQTVFTYLAERGQIVEAVGHTLLAMQNGTIQRRNLESGAISIVNYDSYAFDLTSLLPQTVVPDYKPSERLITHLLSAPSDDIYHAENKAKFVVEFHDRLSQTLYPIAFALWIFICLGDPRSTRQSRTAAIILTTVVCAGQRLVGYGLTGLAVDTLALAPALHALPLLSIVVAIALISTGIRLSGPTRPIKALETLVTALVARIRLPAREVR